MKSAVILILPCSIHALLAVGTLRFPHFPGKTEYPAMGME